jgi:ferrous iron transport protein B
MVLELPTYKLPSLRSALLTTVDRATVFLRKAGTVILAICIVLWWLGEYPAASPSPVEISLRAEAAAAEPERAAELEREADLVAARHAKAQSFIGRIGRVAEPVFRPLGYDWQLTVGVLSSFLAREVFVSTMAVILTGEEDDEAALRRRIVETRRGDGSVLFSRSTSASLLVFYVLAMQCLPTLAVTARETGSWRWSLLQLGYMTVVAYVAAFVTYRVAMLGVA